MLAGDEVHVWYFDLDLSGDALDEAARPVTEDERERAARFLFDVHRRRYLAAHGQLRAILGTYLDGFRVVEGKNGKPELEPAHLHFNLTHSQGLGACAIAPVPVGIDVEVLHDVPDLERVATTCFSAAEQQELLRTAPDERLAAFLRGWTRKEAYLKATGDGLGAALGDFTVPLHGTGPATVAHGWQVQPLDPGPHAFAAVSLPRGTWRVIERRWPASKT